MKHATVTEQTIMIPTYAVGEEQQAPMFFEKRVYQGSSGRVYPNPVTEKIYDEKKDVAYRAVILENDWVKVIVLPELGGRIYTAYDKTNGYDFVYHNHVIKPALVGLLGPWISGGIEFNWPQHHRPTTYMSVNYKVEECPDGSACVYVGEVEAMFGLRHTTCIRLYADKSYIEIATDVYNGEDSPRTFLWWANPAYRVNDDTITVMPPDVNAVMDHGKRAVSTFPIATGEYYKMDYSKGVDISRYKNIPVPTSFMAYKSEFDFIGGYDYGRQAGLLHVADHLVSPGKKQWTWGCGDFGQAWDRNLTDADGPYVELMTGCFTDNQPDFTFLEPHETKQFTQYFMPYHAVGRILNADRNICFGCEDGVLTVFSSVYTKATVCATSTKGEAIRRSFDLTPCSTCRVEGVDAEKPIEVCYDDAKVAFDPAQVKHFDVPSPATACPEPEDCKSIEELYLYGRHIEQYRHATRIAQDYYAEGLRRDPSDIRLNNAYGQCLFQRGLVQESIPYFRAALEKVTAKNTNPQSAESYWNLAIALFETEQYDEAAETFGKCLWGDKRAQGLYYLALIEKIRNRNERALEYARQSVRACGEDVLARNLYASLLAKVDPQAAQREYETVLQYDALNTLAHAALGHQEMLGRVSSDEIRIVAGYLLQRHDYAEALAMLKDWMKQSDQSDILVDYTIAYAMMHTSEDVKAFLKEIRNRRHNKVRFAIRLQDKKIIEALLQVQPDHLLYYHLGNLHYDKRNYDLAAQCWKKSVECDSKFPIAYRNLALYAFNKKRDKKAALSYMEQAFALDSRNARFLLELSQLYDICHMGANKKFALFEQNLETVQDRDDLYADYLSLLTDRGEHAKAAELLAARRFHPWEGGEGKVTKLYKRICCALAQDAIDAKDFACAEEHYRACFTFPENLGEGKLILDYDNDICYQLGELYRLSGKSEQAQEMYQLATRGKTDVADDMYYNDTPVDYVYYIALAHARLGNADQARKIAQAFLAYSRKNKGKHVKIDYFAVSLPDLLVWEQDLDERNDVFCDSVSDMGNRIMEALGE